METFQVKGTAKRRARGNKPYAITGVNASGNLEVLAERVLPEKECLVEVTTAVSGFRDIWQAVIEEFFERSTPGGLRFSINDGGARPDTVTLRLMQSVQLMETEQ
ncbi:MAG TPA: malonate decarboxylase acyl carrier protein [Bradyrhizobium sp.]|nr:malonate decarboxylase acyl carrier protein [Bradyrhizobium sp.]